MADPFAAHIVSLILSWILGVFFLVGLIVCTVGFVFDDNEEASLGRFASFWFMLCLLVFSPIRYLLLQFLLSETFAVQSLSAFFVTCLVATPAALAFGLLYAVGVGLPLLAVAGIAAFRQKQVQPSPLRLILAGLAMPFAFMLGNQMFFSLLPYAAYTTHWLDGKTILKATNGPAEYYYGVVAEWELPFLPTHLDKYDGECARDRLRAHLTDLYLGEKQLRRISLVHFNQALGYNNEATLILNDAGNTDDILIKMSAEVSGRRMTLLWASRREALKTDFDHLNDLIAGLGNHWHDEFIPGITKLIEGEEQIDIQLQLEGQALLGKWVDWYVRQFDNE